MSPDTCAVLNEGTNKPVVAMAAAAIWVSILCIVCQDSKATEMGLDQTSANIDQKREHHCVEEVGQHAV